MGKERPSFIALRDDLAFPSSVRGPQLFKPFTLAASVFLGLVIGHPQARDVFETTLNRIALKLSVPIKL